MIKNVKRVTIIIMICTVLAFTLMSCGVDKSVETVQNMVDGYVNISTRVTIRLLWKLNNTHGKTK